MDSFKDVWDGLSRPWRRSFELAWQAQLAGSVPIGAVIVDSDDDEVSAGRNRAFESGAPSKQLAGTNLAHAEVNALAAMSRPSVAAAGELTLYSTLEPCLLCTAAMLHCRIPRFRFAASDPLWAGIVQIPVINPAWAARCPNMRGRCRVA